MTALHKKAAARGLAGCRTATPTLAVHAALLARFVLAALLLAGLALPALMLLAGLVLAGTVLLLLVALRVVLPLLVPLRVLFICHVDVLQSFAEV